MGTVRRDMSFKKALQWRVEVLSHLSNGVSILSACGLAKVGRATFYRHYNKDEYFRAEVDHARSMSSARVQRALIDMAINGNDWRACAWLLEKHDPANWGSVKDRLRFAGCTCGAKRCLTG